MKFNKKFFLVGFVFLIIIVFVIFEKFKYRTIEDVAIIISSIDNSENIKFKKISESLIQDNYSLNTKYDTDDYFINNLVNAYGKVPLINSDISINVNALYDLEDLFMDLKNHNYDNIIVRRGYLSCSNENDCVTDHRTGYDIDVYIKDREWEDFEGHKEAKYFINNAYRYGFVLRYNKKDNYQPWHFRYVGKVFSYLIHELEYDIDDFVNNLEVNTIYKFNDEETYFYKVKMNNIYIPKNIKYEISSTNSGEYVISYSLKTLTKLSETNDRFDFKLNKLNNENINYNLILVNEDKENKFSSDNLVIFEENKKLDKNAAEGYIKMSEVANKLDNHILFSTSAYRSYEEQKKIFEEENSGIANKPGHSEHETGLALDLATDEKKVTYFYGTYIGKWVTDNAHEYGFILRYLDNKENITKISYEPWHFRFVEEMHATYMYEHYLTLEEYLNLFDLNKKYIMNYDNKNYLMYKYEVNDGNILKLENSVVYYLYDNCYLVVTEM